MPNASANVSTPSEADQANRFSVLPEVQDPKGNDQMPVEAKKPNIPSLFVQPGDDWSTLISILRSQVPNLKSKLQGNFLKIDVPTENDFRNTTTYLSAQGVCFKTYNLKQERPVKVVIRGLPKSTPIQAINAQITAAGFSIINTHQLTKTGSKQKLPLFYLQIAACPHISEIYAITELFGTEVQVEPYQGRKGPSQCHRCQGFWHSSATCYLRQRCVRCAGPHSAADCPPDTPLKCAQCGGGHSANYRGCPKLPKTKQTGKSFKPKPTPAGTPRQPNQFIAVSTGLPLPSARAQNLSFAAVLSGANKAQQQVPNSGTPTDAPAPNLKSSVPHRKIDYAEVLLSLTRVLQTHDNTVLVSAFEQALPDLRNCETEIDIIFQIFKSYAALVK